MFKDFWILFSALHCSQDSQGSQLRVVLEDRAFRAQALYKESGEKISFNDVSTVTEETSHFYALIRHALYIKKVERNISLIQVLTATEEIWQVWAVLKLFLDLARRKKNLSLLDLSALPLVKILEFAEQHPRWIPQLGEKSWFCCPEKDSFRGVSLVIVDRRVILIGEGDSGFLRIILLHTQATTTQIFFAKRRYIVKRNWTLTQTQKCPPFCA